MRCRLTGQGSLTGCTVIAEMPQDEGFGAAAVRLAQLFRFKPHTRSGKPVAGATIVVPISFALPGRAPPKLNLYPGDAAALVTRGGDKGVPFPCPTPDEPERKCRTHRIDWKVRPEISELMPILAESDQESGRSLMECGVSGDGTLTGCKVVGATPKGEAALLRIAPLFTAPARAIDGTSTSGGRILIDVDWTMLTATGPDPG